jgi:hypothetical protein
MLRLAGRMRRARRRSAPASALGGVARVCNCVCVCAGSVRALLSPPSKRLEAASQHFAAGNGPFESLIAFIRAYRSVALREQELSLRRSRRNWCALPPCASVRPAPAASIRHRLVLRTEQTREITILTSAPNIVFHKGYRKFSSHGYRLGLPSPAHAHKDERHAHGVTEALLHGGAGSPGALFAPYPLGTV